MVADLSAKLSAEVDKLRALNIEVYELKQQRDESTAKDNESGKRVDKLTQELATKQKRDKDKEQVSDLYPPGLNQHVC